MKRMIYKYRILLFALGCTSLYGQIALQEKTIPRSVLLEAITNDVSMQTIIKQFGTPMDRYTNDYGDTLLRYEYWPLQSEPVTKTGGIPRSMLLIFRKNKLFFRQEDYAYKRK